MSVPIRCPNCAKTGKVPSTYVGLPVRCPVCHSRFRVPELGKTTDYPIAEPFAPPPATADIMKQAAPTEIFDPGEWILEPDDGPDPVPEKIGRFHILLRLGAGAFGTVYRAHDPVLEREVALKVPKAQTLNSPERIERFLREAKAAARLQHPHIVPVFDSGHDGTQYYIASAYIEGRNLAEVIGEEEPLVGRNRQRSAQIVRQLAEALAYAHSMGIVHRDVKPANILVDDHGWPHLLDFGLAHQHGTGRELPTEKSGENPSSAGQDATLTRAGAKMGTPAYMAPEHAAGRTAEAQPASDQYSLGVVLYELLCGVRPFSGPTDVLLFNVKHKEPPRPRALVHDLPLDLDAICLKAMDKKPEERYGGCQELADDLRRWSEGAETSVRPWGTKERLRHWCRRSPLRAGAVGVAAVALVCLLILTILFGIHQSNALESISQEQKKTGLALQEAKALSASLSYDRAQILGVEQKEPALALPWLVRSSRAASDAKDADLEQAIRLNQTAWYGKLHRLRASMQLDTTYAQAFYADAAYTLLGQDGAISRVNLLHQEEKHHVPLSENQPVTALVVDPKSKMIFAALGKKIVRLNVHGKARDFLEGHAGSITCLAVSPESGEERLLASAGEDQTIRLWDLASGKEELPRFSSKSVTSLAFSPCGRVLLSGGKDGMVRLWDVNSRAELLQYSRRGWEVTAVAYSPRGDQVLIGWKRLLRGEAQIFSLEKRNLTPLATLEHEAELFAAAFSPTGDLVMTGGRDRAARFWDARTGKARGGTLWHPAEVRRVTFSPNGRMVLTADADDTLRLWELADEKTTSDDPISFVNAFGTTHGGNITLKSSLDLDKFPGKDFASVVVLNPTDGMTSRLAVSRDHQTRATLDFAGVVTIRDLAGRRILTVKEKKGRSRKIEMYALALSADGTLLITGGTDKVARVWNTATGEKLHELEHPDSVLTAAFAPDGETFLTGFVGGAQLWRTADFKKYGASLPHITGVFAVAFSSDGKIIATGGTDRTVRLWHGKTKKPIGPPLVHPGPVFALTFAKDHFVSGSLEIDKLLKTGSVWRWPLPAAMPGNVADLETWSQVVTGVRLDEFGVNHVLDAAAWVQLEKQSQKAQEDWRKILMLPAIEAPEFVKFPKVLARRADPKKEIHETDPKKEIPETKPDPKVIDTKIPAGKNSGLLSGDTDLVIQMNFRKMLESDLLKNRKAVLGKVLISLGDSGLDLKRIMGWLKKGDVNWMHDIERLTLGVPSAHRAKSVLIVEGAFQPKKIQAAVEAAKEKDNGVTIYATGSVLIVGLAVPEKEEVFLAVLNRSTLVASWSREEIDQVLARAAGNKSSLKKDLAEFLKGNAGKPNLSWATTGKALARLGQDAPIPNAENVGQALQGIEGLRGAFTIGKDIQFQLDIGARDEETAKRFAEQGNFGLVIAKAVAAQNAKDDKRLLPLVDVLSTFRLEAKGNSLNLRAEASVENVEKLIKNLNLDQK